MCDVFAVGQKSLMNTSKVEFPTSPAKDWLDLPRRFANLETRATATTLHRTWDASLPNSVRLLLDHYVKMVR